MNGFWTVEIEQDGEYEFELRCWPKEANIPISSGIKATVEPIPGGQPLPDGRVLNITQARLQIGDIDVSKPVGKKDPAVTFKVEMKAGKTHVTC